MIDFLLGGVGALGIMFVVIAYYLWKNPPSTGIE